MRTERAARVFVLLTSPYEAARSTRMVLTDITPAKRECLAGTQAGVREYGHERLIAIGRQLASDTLDRFRHEGTHYSLPYDRPLTHRLHRVRRHATPCHGLAAYGLEQCERLSDRRLADSRGAKLRLECIDDTRRQLPELNAAETRQNVEIPDRRVPLLRFSSQLGRGIPLPPLTRELVERHLAVLERGKFSELPATANLRLEPFSVFTAVEGLNALPSAPTAESPADPIDAAARS